MIGTIAIIVKLVGLTLMPILSSGSVSAGKDRPEACQPRKAEKLYRARPLRSWKPEPWGYG